MPASDDGADRIVVKEDWRPGAAVTTLVAAVALFSLLRHRPMLALALLVVSYLVFLRTIQKARRSIAFDGGRREVVVIGYGAPRTIAFDAIRGIRIQRLGRGFQFGVEVVPTSGEAVELMQTGVEGVAKELAHRVSTRFGFAALAD
jgi:hypothetical protein